MDKLLSTQLYSFFIFLITGVLLGMLYDIFRIIRKTFKISDIHTYFEDILFGILAGILLIFVTFVINKGVLRWYMFISLAFGLLIYSLTISKFFVMINVFLLKLFKNIIREIGKILFYPLKILISLIKKMFKKYHTFIVINIKKMKNNFKNIKKAKIIKNNLNNNKGNSVNKSKNILKKKDFKTKCRII